MLLLRNATDWPTRHSDQNGIIACSYTEFGTGGLLPWAMFRSDVKCALSRFGGHVICYDQKHFNSCVTSLFIS